MKNGFDLYYECIFLISEGYYDWSGNYSDHKWLVIDAWAYAVVYRLVQFNPWRKK